MEDKFSAYDNMLEAVHVIDQGMRYIYVNKAVCEYANLPAERFLGFHVLEVYPGIEETLIYKTIANCLQDKQPRESIIEFEHPNGRLSFYLLRMQCIPEGILILSYDVTSQIEAERALATQNELLEKAVNEKTKELQELNEKLHRLSITDELTGLYNRRHFLHRLKAELKRHQRYGNGLSVCMIDIDNFKQINDNYGHDIGDLVLKGVAEILQAHVRENDMLARYGGEEFTVLMPNTHIQFASNLLNRVQQSVFNSPELKPYKITFSAGIAQPEQTTNNVNILLKSADKALYAAKHKGKNQIMLAPTGLNSIIPPVF